MRIRHRLALILTLLCLATPAMAQEVFSGGDSDHGGGGAVFSGGGGSGGDIFNGDGGGAEGGGIGQLFGSVIGSAHCHGPDVVWSNGRCNPRQITSSNGCGPYYNNYQYFIQQEMKHFGPGNCQVRAGGELYCRQMRPYMCNPSDGGRPDDPMVDTGMRYTSDCQMVRTHCGGLSPDAYPPGRKGIHYSPRPNRAPPKNPDDDNLQYGINACLSRLGEDRTGAPITYYTKPQVLYRPAAVTYDRASGQIVIDNAQLKTQPLTTRVFLLGQAYAQHAEHLRYQRYITSGNEARDTIHAEDEIIGFIGICLESRHIVPARNVSDRANFSQDWRSLYAKFIGAPSIDDPRVAQFSRGGGEYPLPPMSLLPPN